MSLQYWECVYGVTGCTADSSRVGTGGCVHSGAARLSWTPQETVGVAAKEPLELRSCSSYGALGSTYSASFSTMARALRACDGRDKDRERVSAKGGAGLPPSQRPLSF
jgi:hypothetical protein